MALTTRKLVDLCVGLGTVPVALFTNATTAVLQKLAECNSIQEACAQAHLPGGAAIPVACVLGALGLTSAAIALKGKQDAAKAADEFKKLAKDVKTIDEVVRTLAAVLQPIGDPEKRLSAAELQELGEALATQDPTKVTDGTAQRMMLVLEAAGLAKADVLEEMAGYTKETWLTTLHIREDQEEMKRWVREADERIRGVLEGIAKDAKVAAEEATAANAKADQILAALVTQGVTLTLEDRCPPRPHKYVERPALMKALADALWGGGRAGVTGRAAAQGDGGQGKSVLALAYAQDHADRYPGGCYRVIVENQSLEAALARMIPALPALSQMPQADKARLARAILSREPRCLLIIDNVDRAAEWNGDAFQSLVPSGACHVIVTSREEKLPGIASVPVGKLEEQEARSVLAAFRTSASEAKHAPAIASILRSVERLAVAVASVGAMMAISDDDDWSAYAARLEAVPLEQYPEGHAAVAAHTGYSRRVFAALDDLYARLPIPAQRAMEYAALLPEDLIPAVDHINGNPPEVTPADWLSMLLTADADPAKGEGRLDLGTRPTGRAWEARDFVKKLQALGLLTPSNPERTLWTLHRLHAKRCKERAGAERRDMAPFLLAIAACAAARRETVVGAKLGGEGFGPDNPAAIMNRSLRWELTPLAETCKGLWEAGHIGSAASVGVWLAGVMRLLGLFAEARACLILSVESEPAIAAVIGHDRLASAYSNLALIQQDQGDLQGARASMEKAIAIDAGHLDPNHPIFALRYSNLAMIRRAQGASHMRERGSGEAQVEFLAARTTMERSIAIDLQHFPPDHSTFAIRYSNLALIQQDQGDLPGARASLEQAFVIDSKHYASDHPVFAIRYSNLAHIQQDEGDISGARASMERSIAIDSKHFAPDHPNLATSYNNLAGILLDAGDRAAACANFKKALAILLKHFGEDHPHVKITRDSMAVVGCAP